MKPATVEGNLLDQPVDVITNIENFGEMFGGTLFCKKFPPILLRLLNSQMHTEAVEVLEEARVGFRDVFGA